MSEPVVQEFLTELEILGVSLELSGKRLKCEAPEGVLTPELRAVLAEHKPEIIGVLQGKALILLTLHQISDVWGEIGPCGGSIAWEWILRGSPHGPKIRAAEDRVNAIGSNGNPVALAAACDAWVSAWRDGIEGWKKANGMTRAGKDR